MAGSRGEPIEISSSDDEVRFLGSFPPPCKRKQATQAGPALAKRPHTTQYNQAANRILVPQDALEISDTSDDEKSDYECFPASQEYDLDIAVDSWPVPRVALLSSKFQKSGETILDARLRQARDPSHEGRFLQLRTVTGTRNILSSCLPLTRSHAPLVRRIQQRKLGSFSFDALNCYHSRRLKPLPELRLGGCPNTISQSYGIALIAANVHGVSDDTDAISPANHNGLTVVSSLEGVRLPINSAGHVKRISPEKDRDAPGVAAHSRRGVIYETVYDAQFDPANPKRFITAGNDDRAIIWDINETDVGGLQVGSACDGNPGKEYDKPMGSRPHFIRFSSNRRHWASLDDETSAFAITDAEGRFHVEFPTKQSLVVTADSTRRQISSIMWGTGPTANTIFAGTEADGYLKINGGKQAAFDIHPSRAVARFYTDCLDEVQHLAMNPAGNLVASFTRKCYTTSPLCKKCGRTGFYSRHKLSLYPASGKETITTRRGNRAVIAEVNLPDFKEFNGAYTANEAGLVVSAAWSPCGRYIAAARDDDAIDIFDSRYLGPLPLMRLSHRTPRRAGLYREHFVTNANGTILKCCDIPEKHPAHGVTGLQWIEGAGYFGGEGLLSAGSDGCVRLWDIRQTETYEALVHLETSAACISVGDISRKEVSLIAADNDGLIEMRTAAS